MTSDPSLRAVGTLAGGLGGLEVIRAIQGSQWRVPGETVHRTLGFLYRPWGKNQGVQSLNEPPWENQATSTEIREDESTPYLGCEFIWESAIFVCVCVCVYDTESMFLTHCHDAPSLLVLRTVKSGNRQTEDRPITTYR